MSDLIIAVGEQLLRDSSYEEMEVWYHASLILLHDDIHGNRTVLQKLDFINSNDWLLTPVVNVRFRQFSDLSFSSLSPVFSGCERSVLQRWNVGLETAKNIGLLGKRFGSDYRHSDVDLNCRTGVKLVIQSMRIDVKNDFFKSTAGLFCDDIVLEDVCDPLVTDSVPLNRVRAENQVLVEALECR